MKIVKLGAAVLVIQMGLMGCVTVNEDGKSPVVKADPVAMAESRIALGLGYLESGSMIRAHDNLQQALTHAPSYYRAQLSMAHYYETVGEDVKAEQMYKRSLRQNAKNGNVRRTQNVDAAAAVSCCLSGVKLVIIGVDDPGEEFRFINFLLGVVKLLLL